MLYVCERQGDDEMEEKKKKNRRRRRSRAFVRDVRKFSDEATSEF
jgi:hypothetical protein